MKTGSRLKNGPLGMAAVTQELLGNLFNQCFPHLRTARGIHSLGFPICFSGLIPPLMQGSHIYAL